MTDRQQHTKGLVIHRLRHQAGFGKWQGDDDHIQITGLDGRYQLLGVALLDDQSHLRCPLTQQRHQTGQQIGGDGVDDADA